MPFKSKAQRRWMHATEPAMAARWESETPRGANLPEHARPKAKPKAKPAPKPKPKKRPDDERMFVALSPKLGK